MNPGLIGQAIALFALTNIDDIIVLAVFFGQATSRSGRLRVVLGQYIGFAGILLAAVVGTLGQDFSPRRPSPTWVSCRCSSVYARPGRSGGNVGRPRPGGEAGSETGTPTYKNPLIQVHSQEC
jgi:hypothetical protein